MFGTSGVRGEFGEQITADLALEIGRAVAINGADCILIGRDSRTTGSVLLDAAAAGAREYGADVISIGYAATPTIARNVPWTDADVGIAVTASHNPPTDNGIKLWDSDGMAFDEEKQQRITEIVQSDEMSFNPSWNSVGATTVDTQAAHRRHRSALVDAAVSDHVGELSVVVDVGNGVGKITAEAFRDLGCTVNTLNANPDGKFPARPAEPTAEACTVLRQHVASTDADLGVAHDGDADRMMAVDETGSFVTGDALLALFAREAVSPGDSIAVPINTSLSVEDTVEQAGGNIVRTKVGDVYVATEAKRSEVIFGGEPSGAWIWPEETLCPDGPLAAIRLADLVANRGPLSDIVTEIPSYPLRRESHSVDDKHVIMDKIADHAQRYDSVTRVDGVRIETDDGWMLLRASGTESLVRLTAESRSSEKADQLLAEARDILQTYR